MTAEGASAGEWLVGGGWPGPASVRLSDESATVTKPCHSVSTPVATPRDAHDVAGSHIDRKFLSNERRKCKINGVCSSGYLDVAGCF